MSLSRLTRRESLHLLAAASGLSLGAVPRPAVAATPLEEAFDKLVRAEGFTDDAPGLAVMARRGDAAPFFRCVGLARIKDRRPVTPQTMFELASVSKTMTASAILLLHDRKRLSVTDDVREHLPELPPAEKNAPIRIRDLLQHTSGLASYMDLADVPARNKDYWINDDYVGEFARQKVPALFAAGARHEYNNTNYLLLAVIVARATRKRFGEFLREAIFDPAGMKTAFVSEGPGSVPARAGRVDAIGYSKEEGVWEEQWALPPDRTETLLTCGDGAIWCSAEDMAAWDAFLHSGRLLKPGTVQMALTPAKTRDGKFHSYGLGWGLYFEGSRKATGYGHSGGWGGFGTYYWHDLLTKRTIVMLGNGRPLDMDKFWESLTELFNKHGDA